MTNDAPIPIRAQAEHLLGSVLLAGAAFEWRSMGDWSVPELLVTIVRHVRSRTRPLGKLPHPLFLAVSPAEVAVFPFEFGITTRLNQPRRRWPRSDVRIAHRDDRPEPFTLRVQNRTCELRPLADNDETNEVVRLLAAGA